MAELTLKQNRVRKKGLLHNIKHHPHVYMMAIPVAAYFIIFHYLPMYGVIMAFQDFVPARGFFRSDWVGFEHFKDFFGGIYFLRLLKNTLSLNVAQLVFGFPVPIVFALLLNEIRSNSLKKLTQTVTYMPHFVSAVVICGIIIDFVSSRGVLPSLLNDLFGLKPVNLLNQPELFSTIFVTMNVWQQFGWGSIIFLAAISGIDPQLYESAVIDGATRFRQIWHITIPGILPTIVVLLILRIGRLMSLGWEQIVLLYNPNVYETADVISTFVYRRGLIQFDYSFSSAVGLFNSVLNLILLLSANWLSKRVNETSLW